MSSYSGGCFQSCRVTKARISLNWHKHWQTWWVLRWEGWKNACCHHCYMLAMKVRSSATSVKFPSRKCGKCSSVRLSRVPLSTRYQRSMWAGRCHANSPWCIKFKIVLMAILSVLVVRVQPILSWGDIHSRVCCKQAENVSICSIDGELKEKLKKFRFRKATNNAAIISKKIIIS